MKKISHRVFVASMLIAVIPIGLMGGQAYVLAKKALTAFAFLHMETIAEDHARHLDAWLTERLGDVAVLARLPLIREATLEYCCAGSSDTSVAKLVASFTDTLARTEERSASYKSIHVMLPDGRIIASTHPPSEDFSDLQREGFVQRLKEGSEPAFGPVCRGDDSRWHMLMGAPIQDQDGATLAVVVAVLDVSRTIDPVMNDRIGLGETGETYLVGKEGKIISESRFLDRSETTKRAFDTFGIRSVLQEKRGTAVYVNYTGQEVLGSYLWLPRYEWGVLAEMGTEEILWPLKWIKAAGIISAILVCGICFLMAYGASRRIAEPIIAVAAAARRLAEGDLEQHIAFTGEGEVGALARSFNSMARQVSGLIHSLHCKEESLQKAYDELVVTQDQLVRSERMAAIGELVACIAHEMRNPLSSVKLNLQIMETDLVADEVLSEHCQIALDQVALLDRMFSDLLNYSKPLALEKSSAALEELVSRSLEQLSAEITSGEILVNRREDPAMGSVMADADKIVQVLVNVLKNAIEASPHGGRIEITVEEETGPRGKMVAIGIIDQGPGISARNLLVMFQPFFTTKKRGTGLGLCIVQKIMDAHNGTISISTEEGKGTLVRLTLPVA